MVSRDTTFGSPSALATDSNFSTSPANFFAFTVWRSRPAFLIRNLHLHYLLFLGLPHIFQLVHKVIRQLLNLIERFLLVVFGDGFVFEHFLHVLIAIAANVAHSGAVLFENLVNVFRQSLAPFFRQGWDRNTDGAAVV